MPQNTTRNTLTRKSNMPDITPPQRTCNSTCSLVTPELALSTPPLRTSTPTLRPPCELSSRQYSHRHHVNSAGPGGSSTRPCCSLLQPVGDGGCSPGYALQPARRRVAARAAGGCSLDDRGLTTTARHGGAPVLGAQRRLVDEQRTYRAEFLRRSKWGGRSRARRCAEAQLHGRCAAPPGVP